jgi:hypothetical protein
VIDDDCEKILFDPVQKIFAVEQSNQQAQLDFLITQLCFEYAVFGEIDLFLKIDQRQLQDNYCKKIKSVQCVNNFEF